MQQTDRGSHPGGFTSRLSRIKSGMEVLMPTRTRHPDECGAATQQPDITPLTHQARHYQQASYTALEAMFGVLCGSI
jgi:hypothetical protein